MKKKYAGDEDVRVGYDDGDSERVAEKFVAEVVKLRDVGQIPG